MTAPLHSNTIPVRRYPSSQGTHIDTPAPVNRRQLTGTSLAGRYLVGEKLGEGGFGAVYHGKHLELDGDVAIKVLLVHGEDSAEFSRRFRHEASALSRLRHPNIVEVLDFGAEDTIEYLVLEYIDGRDLFKELKGGAIAWPRALLIARQISLALAAAHEIGVVHRDLKPGNVMLVDLPGSPDHVKVLDFGIAKILREDSDIRRPDDPKTQVGLAVGTPVYMSPEQCKGEQLDGRADLYALGVLLLELLTGNQPYQAGSAVEIMGRHIHGDIPSLGDPPSGQPWPDGLQSLLNDLLAKERDERPANAEAVVVAIDTLMGGVSGVMPRDMVMMATGVLTPLAAGETISREPPPRASPFGRFAILAAAVVGLLLVGGLGIFPSLAPPPPTTPSVSTGPEFVSLEIISVPSGAEVRLDGKSLGHTPLSAMRSETPSSLQDIGRYQVSLKGHEISKVDFSVSQGGHGPIVRGVLRLKPVTEASALDDKQIAPKPKPSARARAPRKAAAKAIAPPPPRSRPGKRSKGQPKGGGVEIDLDL